MEDQTQDPTCLINILSLGYMSKTSYFLMFTQHLTKLPRLALNLFCSLQVKSVILLPTPPGLTYILYTSANTQQSRKTKVNGYYLFNSSIYTINYLLNFRKQKMSITSEKIAYVIRKNGYSFDSSIKKNFSESTLRNSCKSIQELNMSQGSASAKKK